jgi:hypothetical protein
MKDYGYGFKNNDFSIVKLMIDTETTGMMFRLTQRIKIVEKEYPDRVDLVQQIKEDLLIMMKVQKFMIETQEQIKQSQSEFQDLLTIYYEKCRELSVIKDNQRQNKLIEQL